MCIRDSGKIDEVTDEEILHAYQLIAREEGVFAEPGSCASIACLLYTSDAADDGIPV
ncbi:hypothetical protein H8939_18540, partial [Bacillus pumilus]|nr:hypothetical protein [Bacillus pumilus]